MSFEQFGLDAAILSAIEGLGYQSPSPIQQQAIPIVLQNRDLLAAAQTGTGKTAAFALPLLQRLNQGNRAGSNRVRSLIITPTRELAAQVHANIKEYAVNLRLNTAVVFGGVKINPQMMAMRKGVDVLVATPGRLLDLHAQNAIKFDDLEMLVMDEADRMLDMGFIHDIKKILKVLPKQRQTLLFSATFSKDIRALAVQLLSQPEEVAIAPKVTTAQSVKQILHPVDKAMKAAALTHLIKEGGWHQVLVFVRTKHGANKLAKKLDSAGIKTAAIHGNKSQNARTRALADFSDGKVQALVATDIAARGLDIEQLPHVVNHDLPNVPEDYVHRIGRTGRASAQGEAVSLVSADEIKQLVDIERCIGRHIGREYLSGFEPKHELPASPKVLRANKPKRPKKSKPDQGRSQIKSGESRSNRNTRQKHKNYRAKPSKGGWAS